MKANHSKFGIVTVINRHEDGVNIVTEDGKNVRIMTAFVKLTDENGNVITDFSSLPEQGEYIIKNNSGDKKESKLASMMASAHEGETYNALSKNWVKQ